ncbi:KUP/HAK/KT family potassium transporter [Anaerocolumna chitinilytica]|uniref:Probable potassium transport system protein Kup n=1 Tax=Anaerocolumna chitinilytica TaxID=1727145 RepID=A0A7I8DMU3_9FIRM|nr:KUP/HAK/KT family potassium transporter [Anaerocolumna chitinilytica]BCJ98611.1 putative potassium transport system protein kup [Anaerocolumna chitinilytica]
MVSSKKSHITKLSLGGILVTLGVVYGDIGTSPLYVMKSVLQGNGGLENVSDNFILGTLSLVFWTLTILTTIKYVFITLRADNKGEGGIFSLFALVRNRSKWLVIPAMIGGSALLADGMLTPAVTVTSAVEGLKLLPVFNDIFGNNQRNIVILVIAIICILFFIQHSGTEFIGKLFGPIMFLWFSSLAVFGIINLADNPFLLRALSPHYAVSILFSSDNKLGFFILGSIFLCSTGAEALYSDLGHVGRKNIYFTWPFVKLCLLLNYFGQGAWILSAKTSQHTLEDVNPFYQMIPSGFLIYGIVISTLAAIIASQALISGSFTLVSEAIKLNLFPRLHTLYPSSLKGQLYIPAINRILCVVCIGIVLYFQSSDKMEAAYGLAITVTMLMTTILLFNYMRKKNAPIVLAVIMLVFFMSFEASFFLANIIKFFHGGFVAVIIAISILFIMYIWDRSHIIKMRFREVVPIENYIAQLNQLRHDPDVPKYASNLVCLTNCPNTKEVERKIMYFLLDKRPKRADVYWFVNVYVTDEPYQADYVVEKYNTSFIVNIQINLGFRIEQNLNVFLRQISTEMVNNKEIDNQSNAYSIIPNRKLGDFRFVFIEEVLSNQSSLSGWDSFLLRTKFFIQKFTVSPSNWFGLDTSDVYIEKVPMILGHSNRTVLKRNSKPSCEKH